MAHDHGEKIHFCEKCGYWHVASGRFEIWSCPKCKEELNVYASRQWIIDNIDKKFKGIPKNEVRHLGAEGFIV